MYMKNDKELLTDFAKSRNLKQTTINVYKSYIKTYTQYQQKSLVDLIQEAEKEEEQGIRWKNRTLKKKINELQIIYL